MKRLYRMFCVFAIIFVMTACSSGSYKVLKSLDAGSIQIEYEGVIYTETGTFKGSPPGEKIFSINYKEVCDTVAYDVYLDNDTMYLKGLQPIWADAMAVNFVLTAEDGASNT